MGLTVLQPEHPIFDGITLVAGNTLISTSSDLVTAHEVPSARSAGYHRSHRGRRRVLASVATEGDPSFGGLVIGEWQAGSVMANATPTRWVVIVW